MLLIGRIFFISFLIPTILCFCGNSSPVYDKDEEWFVNMLQKHISEPFKKTINLCSEAVVYIEADEVSQHGYDQHDIFRDDFFGRFFIPYNRQQHFSRVHRGSGFFISNNGYIVTNFHVVCDAKKIKISFGEAGNRKNFQAVLIGVDAPTDIALLKVVGCDEGEQFPYLELDKDWNIYGGCYVFAMGYPYGISDHVSVSVGIVSANVINNFQGFEVGRVVQICAPINQGNSGGPVVNVSNGKVVAMATAFISNSKSNSGVNMGISCGTIEKTVEQLKTNGVVTRGFLGIQSQEINEGLADALDLEDGSKGVLVTAINEQSPAANGGLQVGDVILRVNGNSVDSGAQLKNEIMMLSPGESVHLLISRASNSQGHEPSARELIDIMVVLGSYESSPLHLSEVGICVDNLTAVNLRKYEDLRASDKGVVVVEVEDGSHAYMSGIKPGCLIISVCGKDVHDVATFKNEIANAPKRKPVYFTIRQNNEIQFYTFNIHKRKHEEDREAPTTHTQQEPTKRL